MNQKDLSIKEMKQVIQIDPEHANALNYLGFTYAESGMYLDEAEELIKKALKLKPNDGYITDSLGWVYFKKGLFDQAVLWLEKATRLAPDDPIILEHLADAYTKKNLLKAALKYYKMALEKQEKEENNIKLKEKIERIKKKVRNNK
jgi:tetratricopeptide (TPR) repeat protein